MLKKYEIDSLLLGLPCFLFVCFFESLKVLWFKDKGAVFPGPSASEILLLMYSIGSGHAPLLHPYQQQVIPFRRI